MDNYEQKRQRFQEHIEQDYGSFIIGCFNTLSKDDLLVYAQKISAMNEAHIYLENNCKDFSDAELDYFLAFDTPCIMVADVILKQREQQQYIGESIKKLADEQTYMDGEKYALTKPTQKRDEPER